MGVVPRLRESIGGNEALVLVCCRGAVIVVGSALVALGRGAGLMEVSWPPNVRVETD